MNELEQALVNAAVAGRNLTVSDLSADDDLQAAVAETAAGPLAPELAASFRQALDGGETGFDPLLEAFVHGLGQQRSYLALREATDELLAAEDLSGSMARALHDAMIPLGYLAEQSPRLAALGLEVALRVSIIGAAPRFAVLAQLIDTSGSHHPAYTDRLAAMIGTALDLLAAPSDRADLVAALQVLAESEADDARFELAVLDLRDALIAADQATAQTAIRLARAKFRAVSDRDEGRDDATAYAAACEAVIAFNERDLGALRMAAEAARQTANRRALLLLRTHQRTWKAPRRAAEIAWLSLAWRLETAAIELQAEEFLDTSEAINALVSIYRHDRARSPCGPDTAMLVHPAVENQVASRQAMVRQLQRAIDIDVLRDDPQLPPEAAQLLQAVRRARPRSVRVSGQDADPTEPPYLPHLSTLLDGDLEAIAPNGGLTGEQLRRLDRAAASLTWNGLTEVDDLSHPVLDEIEQTVFAALEDNQSFLTSAGQNFKLLVRISLRFLLMVADEPAPYMKELKAGDDAPLEAEFQRQYSQALKISPLAGRVGIELHDVAGGRADVYVSFNEAQRFIIEIKREQADASRQSVETSYLTQALEYQRTNVPLGILLVLDLTSHIHGLPHLKDTIWVVHRDPASSGTRQSAVVGVVAGNRPVPSAMKG
jgi:hypothetical protein